MEGNDTVAANLQSRTCVTRAQEEFKEGSVFIRPRSLLLGCKAKPHTHHHTNTYPHTCNTCILRHSILPKTSARKDDLQRTYKSLDSSCSPAVHNTKQLDPSYSIVVSIHVTNLTCGVVALTCFQFSWV